MQPGEISGEVQRIVFRHPETGFAVMRLRVQGRKEPVTVVGKTLAGEGEIIHASGQWKSHPKFGQQLEATRVQVELPSTPKGVERYLASGVIAGIGPGIAKKLVTAFGGTALDVLENTPGELATVPGLGPKKIEKILKGWDAQREAGRIVAALADYDIGIAIALRIYRKFGADALTLIKTNPYRMTEVPGVGFLKADQIALSAGTRHDDFARIEAGIKHAVREASANGHVGLKADDALRRSAELLKLPPVTVKGVLEGLLASRRKDGLVEVQHPEWGRCVMIGRLYEAEACIAEELVEWAAQPTRWKISREKAHELALEAAASCGVELAEEQMQSVVMALMCRVSILTGGPGTGKTSTLKVVLSALRRVGAKVVMGAPTGKAAKRMRETTGHDAQTIARLTGMGSFEDPDPIEGDILILDEGSMVDVNMLRDVINLMDEGMGLLMVGDVDQLPSVGPGHVLGDLINSAAIPTTRLTKVFRQAQQSAIVRNAHRINRGELPERSEKGSDFYFIEAATPEAITDRIVKLVTKSIPEHFGFKPSEIQILSPMRRTPTGAGNLNEVIQNAVNPRPAREVVRGGTRYGVLDRVLQTANNYDLGVMNGESGHVVDIRQDDGLLTLDIDGTLVNYPFKDIDQLDLAYAMSVHKSQGSQFPCVVIPVTTQHYNMLQRAILYTAVTRATKLCVLVGQTRALQMAINNARSEPRLTMLRHLIEAKVDA